MIAPLTLHLKEPTAEAKTCGGCTLCCKVLVIPELDKPQNEWCSHARKSAGCAIYASRPTVCREFKCLWLTMEFPASMRPDRIHGVIKPTADGEHLQINEDPGYPGVAHAALRPMLDQWVKDGSRYYVVITGARRVFVGNPALYRQRIAE